MLLTDLGATTIKVEPPGAGEGTRKLLAEDPDHSRDGMGAYFLTLNRSKKSVAIDLKSSEGLAVFDDRDDDEREDDDEFSDERGPETAEQGPETAAPPPEADRFEVWR